MSALYEDAAAACIDPGPEPGYGQRLAAAVKVLKREAERRPALAASIVNCAGPSPHREHRERLRAVLVTLDYG